MKFASEQGDVHQILKIIGAYSEYRDFANSEGKSEGYVS